ncbi:MAG: phosphatase PAP2 family protein [Proteobacteria bacterium]|nr:phosphatase PAP2 family protein [Pseudomonadota bacterium]
MPRRAFTSGEAMNRLERGMVYLIPVLLLVAEAIALGFDRSIAPHHALQPLNGQLLFTATAAAIALMTTRRSEIGDLCGLTGILAAILLPVCYGFGARGLTLLSIFGEGLWLASLLLAARAVLASRGERRRSALDLLVIRFSLPICLPLLQVMLWIQSHSFAQVYDLHLYAFDGLFGGNVVKSVAVFVRSVPGLITVLWVIYQSLVPAVALFVVLQRTEHGFVHGKLLSRFLVAAALGYALYAMMPGIGPLMTFVDVFPYGLPDAASVVPGPFAEFDGAPRNAMPSLHTAWALLVFIAAWPMGPWLRLVGGVFLAGTLGATLALGEHYLVDLIVAVPFVVLVEGIAANPFAPEQRRRALQAIVGGIAMIATWLLAIRFATVAFHGLPLVPWLMTFATLGLSLLLLVRLLAPSAPRVSAVPATTAHPVAGALLAAD